MIEDSSGILFALGSKERRSGMDKKIYIGLVGIVGVVPASGLYNLLFAVFPMKTK